MGPVIAPNILKAIDQVPATNLNALLDDQTLFALNTNGPMAGYSYDYKGKKYLDVLKLNIPQNVNIINGDLAGMVKGVTNEGQTPLGEIVKYISIGWSNYGEVYVVADKRMPQTIFLIFRGTYSAKTAGLYTKPTSLIPLEVCPGEKFLYGIFKPTAEMIHTLVETIRYLAVDFLKATTEKPVKIFTTGHSLGGAMCSIFSYLWTTTVKETTIYQEAPYNVLSKNIVCVSLGAPRCFGKQPARKFCDLAMKNQILYLRIVTKGDPVTALPFKMAGFDHPCSDNDTDRKKVVEMCTATLTMRPKPNISYGTALDCQNETLRPYGPNPWSHTVYLDIIFTYAVDFPNFVKGINPFGPSKEVLRANDAFKSTVCRLVEGYANSFKDVFFNVNQARETPSAVDVEFENLETKESSEGVSDLSKLQQVGGGLWPFSSAKVAPPGSSPIPNSQTATIVNKPTTTTPSKPSTMINMLKSTVLTSPVTNKIQPATNATTATTATTPTTPTTAPTATTVTTATTATTATNATSQPSAKKTSSILSSVPKLPSGKIGGPVAEDVRMTRQAFDRLMKNLNPITITNASEGSSDATPQTGNIVNPFIVSTPQEPKMMPKLYCLANQKPIAPVAVAPASTVLAASATLPSVAKPNAMSPGLSRPAGATITKMPSATTTLKGGKRGRKTHRRARNQRTHCNKKRRSCYRRKKKLSRR